jgi:hypothetical protein
MWPISACDPDLGLDRHLNGSGIVAANSASGGGVPGFERTVSAAIPILQIQPLGSLYKGH